MNDKRIIIALHNLADDLDQTGLYKYSEEIDGIANRLAILNLPPQRLNHPGTDDLKRNYLEPLPPQNLLETLYQDFAGYGKPLPKVKLPFFPETKIDWTPDRFFADVIRDFEGTGHINNDFQDLLILSPKFVNLLHDYIFVKKEGNTRLVDQFKEMIEKGEFALRYQLRREFKKLKSVYRDSNKTNIRRVLPALLKISEILPTELLSEVQAMNEWLEKQWTNETEIYDAERAYEPRFKDKLDAHEELKDYLSPTDEEIENLQRTSVSNKMNKRKILASLNKIANELDNSKLYEEANSLTSVMKRLAQDDNETFKTRTNQDEDYTELVMNYVFGKLWPIIIWKLYREDHPINKFSGSEKLRFVCKKMRDIHEEMEMSDTYATPQELRSIVNIYQDFLKMFINSEYISRKENAIRNEKLNNFLSLLDEAEKAINEGRAEEFYNSLPD